jgi:hypothetical protein
MLANSHDEVARFKIAVNEVAGMDELQAADLDIEDISQLFIASPMRLTSWRARNRTVLMLNQWWQRTKRSLREWLR